MAKLRPYQSEACRKIIGEFDKGVQRTLLILPTGCGKTVVFNGVAFKFAYNLDRSPSGGKVLILAHQNILISQAAEKFKSIMGIETDRIKGKQKPKGLPIAVSSVQTMQRRLDRYAPDAFDLIIIDEAHHSMSAGYQAVLSHFSGAKVLGVTATPDRADGKRLECFESIAFQYTIHEAIEDGYLAPITVRSTPLGIDLSKVRKSHGDLLDTDIGNAIEPHLHEIAKVVRREAEGRRIVCFVPLIRTAQKAAEIFSHYGFRSAWTAGNDKEKDEKLKAFAEGKYDIIFNSMLLTEGWDCPETDCVIVLRPTMSRALYVQMVGRGLRLAPGKDDCLLIDFLFQNSSFSLAGPNDVIGKNPVHRSGTAAPWMTGGGPAKDAEERLKEALDAAAKRLQDPHDVPEWSAAIQKIPASTLFDPAPSDAQKRKLKKMKLDPDKVTYSEAEAILKAADAAREPSRAMCWRLTQLGYSNDEIAQMNWLTARKALSQAKAMGRW